MGEAEEAVEGHPGREQLNESFKFRDLEQLNEEFGSHGAAQTDTEMEQLIRAPWKRWFEDCISEVYQD